MATFVYKAKDGAGKLVEGNMDAESMADVRRRLQSMSLFPIKVEGGAKDGEIELDGMQSLSLSLFGVRISIEERANFYRELSDLIGAGIPLARSLTILYEQTENKQLKAIVGNINKEVQGGMRLYASMAKHKTVFRPLELSMIRAGEEGSLLDDVLNRLANFTEREKELREKIIASLTYPCIMLAVGLIVITVLLTFVFPRMISVYSNANQELPWITITLMNVSDFIKDWWWLIGIGIVSGAIVFVNFVKTEEGKRLWHSFLLKLPKVSTLIIKREVSRFARTFGSLLNNGVALLTALDITEDVIANVAIRQKIAEIPEKVTKGEGVSGPMRRAGIFPATVINMIAVGEETGNLDKTLLRVADSYENQVATELKKVVSLIEPCIMILMAIVVAIVVIAMLLPLVGMDPSGGL
jgi:type II secretory pathway component PulF